MSDLFWRREDGGTAATFGIVAIPIILAVGLGVDYAAMARDRTLVQGISDRAILYAAHLTDGTPEEISKSIRDFITQSPDAKGIDRIEGVEVTFPTEDRIKVTIKAHKPTSLLNVLQDRLEYTVTNESFRGLAGKLEVVFVLDNTYSMTAMAGSVTKLQALKTAARTLVEKVSEEAGGSAKFGLVPFSNYVNLGTSRDPSWLSVDDDGDGLKWMPVGAKTCSSGTVDGVDGTVCTYPSWEQQTTYLKWNGCVGSRPHPLNLDNENPTTKYPGIMDVSCSRALTPLTEDASAIKTEINAMTASGETYIPVGLVWGLNMLTQGAPRSKAEAFDPDGKNIRPRKVLVLMTDGNNTLGPVSPNFSRHGNAGKTLANGYTSSLCTNIKGKNIEIYTVAFQVDDGATRTMLQDCATDSAKYFTANDDSALLGSFLKIAKSLKQVRLSQ